MKKIYKVFTRDFDQSVQEIAREVLESAMNYVTSEPLADLKKAIDGLREVQASPYFNPEKIGKN